MYKFSTWFSIQMTPFFIDFKSIWPLIFAKSYIWLGPSLFCVLNPRTANLMKDPPGPNCIKRVQNATESLLMANNGSLTVHVPGSNAVPHVQTLNLRDTNRAAQALTVTKNITLEPRSPNRVTHALGQFHSTSVFTRFHTSATFHHVCIDRSNTNGNTSRFLPFNAVRYRSHNASHSTNYVPPSSTGMVWNGKRNFTV